MMYLLIRPSDKLESKNRASGWRHVPLERDSKKQLREACTRLKERNIHAIHVSDLDEEAGRIAASELNVPMRSDFGLRRFNIGKQHAARTDHLERVLELVIRKWRDNPTIPIKGGDSLSSLEKRLFRTVDKLLAEEEDSIFITDSMTANLIRDRKPESLLLNGKGVERGKIYLVKRGTA